MDLRGPLTRTHKFPLEYPLTNKTPNSRSRPWPISRWPENPTETPPYPSPSISFGQTTCYIHSAQIVVENLFPHLSRSGKLDPVFKHLHTHTTLPPCKYSFDGVTKMSQQIRMCAYILVFFATLGIFRLSPKYLILMQCCQYSLLWSSGISIRYLIQLFTSHRTLQDLVQHVEPKFKRYLAETLHFGACIKNSKPVI